MKRLSADSPIAGEDHKMKKVKQEEEVKEEDVNETGFTNLDENLLFEVLKHADARTLARAACVNKLWHRTAQDERLWELICTRHCANFGCANHQLRSVVLALGGFRSLHSLYLQPLSRPPPGAPPSSSKWHPLPRVMGKKTPANWGRDEVHLSLSLLSVRYYEMMNSRDLGK
ncbi:putative F-box protein GID2 [Melia azedarach]|uniref:F-box protein GID2 n=1 Tax=Melia azedarach TaxID=155640 RepID=A0ACC1WRU1_MELAZ|nr:putative F-box protein GID2 [Melia azedarach]